MSTPIDVVKGENAVDGCEAIDFASVPRLIKSIAIRGEKLEYSPLVDRQITVKEKGPAINAFEIAGPFSEWALSLGY